MANVIRNTSQRLAYMGGEAVDAYINGAKVFGGYTKKDFGMFVAQPYRSPYAYLGRIRPAGLLEILDSINLGRLYTANNPKVYTRFGKYAFVPDLGTTGRYNVVCVDKDTGTFDTDYGTYALPKPYNYMTFFSPDASIIAYASGKDKVTFGQLSLDGELVKTATVTVDSTLIASSRFTIVISPSGTAIVATSTYNTPVPTYVVKYDKSTGTASVVYSFDRQQYTYPGQSWVSFDGNWVLVIPSNSHRLILNVTTGDTYDTYNDTAMTNALFITDLRTTTPTWPSFITADSTVSPRAYRWDETESAYVRVTCPFTINRQITGTVKWDPIYQVAVFSGSTVGSGEGNVCIIKDGEEFPVRMDCSFQSGRVVTYVTSTGPISSYGLYTGYNYASYGGGHFAIDWEDGIGSYTFIESTWPTQPTRWSTFHNMVCHGYASSSLFGWYNPNNMTVTTVDAPDVLAQASTYVAEI